MRFSVEFKYTISIFRNYKKVCKVISVEAFIKGYTKREGTVIFCTPYKAY